MRVQGEKTRSIRAAPDGGWIAVLDQTLRNGPHGSGNVAFDFVFPEANDIPPPLLQCTGNRAITQLTATKLVRPELCICFRFDRMLRASVPEAAVNKNSQTRP